MSTTLARGFGANMPRDTASNYSIVLPSQAICLNIISGVGKSAQWLKILADGKAFEVEFSDRDGRTYESVGLRPDQITVLHYEPIKVQPMSAVE